MRAEASSLPTVAILAGGQSRRMGRDKAGIRVGDETLLERTVRVAREAGAEVLVVGREQPAEGSWDGVSFCLDEVPGAGPLGGLITALRREASVALLACDMPLLTREAVRWLLSQRTAEKALGVAVRNGERIEPLFSLYLGRCLEVCEGRSARGQLSLTGLVEAEEFIQVSAPEWVRGRLLNANTPEDLSDVSTIEAQLGAGPQEQ